MTEPEPPPARRRSILTLIAWLVIAGATAYIIATTAIEKNSDPEPARRTADVGFRIAARYAVGTHRILSAFGPAGGGQANSLLAQVDAAAKSRDERVAAAIIGGEVAGADAALQRLALLPPDEGADDIEALRAIYTPGSAAPLSVKQSEALVTRHGWFGRVALAYGLSPDDPARRAALRPAVRTAVTVVVAMFLGGAAFLAGLVVIAVAIVRWTDTRLPRVYRRPAGPTGPFLEAFAAYIAGMVIVSALARLLLGERVVAIWFVIVILPFAFFWPLLRGVSRSELREGLGWHRGRGVWREIGAGIAGYLAGLPLLAGGALITLLLQRWAHSDTSHPIVNEFGRGGWRTVRLFLLAAVWAPVVEETMFRGALYHHLRARLPWPAAAGTVALLFAAVHPQGWAAIPVLGAIAFSFATLREWRGSIIAPAVAHAINNGAVTLLLVLLLA